MSKTIDPFELTPEPYDDDSIQHMYVLYHSDCHGYNDHSILGVYSSLEKAEEEEGYVTNYCRCCLYIRTYIVDGDYR